MTDAPSDVPAEVRSEHAELAEQVREHRHRYYVLDAPTVSDGEFDALFADTQKQLDEYLDPAPIDRLSRRLQKAGSTK